MAGRYKLDLVFEAISVYLHGHSRDVIKVLALQLYMHAEHTAKHH